MGDGANTPNHHRKLKLSSTKDNCLGKRVRESVRPLVFLGFFFVCVCLFDIVCVCVRVRVRVCGVCLFVFSFLNCCVCLCLYERGCVCVRVRASVIRQHLM